MEKNTHSKTVTETKAAIYDEMAIIEQAQRNIMALNDVLKRALEEDENSDKPGAK